MCIATKSFYSMTEVTSDSKEPVIDEIRIGREDLRS
jgi:hypothetical protein